jgi:hypothetical protein
MLSVEVIEPKYDNDRFRYLADNAIRVFMHERTKNAEQKMLDVLAGLSRQAYLKGRHDMKRELNG